MIFRLTLDNGDYLEALAFASVAQNFGANTVQIG